MKEYRRIFGAFATAPVVTALFFTVAYAVSWTFDSPRPNWHGWLDVLHDVVSTLIIYGLCGAIVSLFFGLPMYLLYRRLGWQSWLAFAVGGAAIGGATAIVLTATGLAMFLGNPPILAVYCSLAGLLSSVAFRAVAFSSASESGR